MAREVKRLATTQVYNKPHLILPDSLKEICNYLDVRNGATTWKKEILEAAIESNKAADEYKQTMNFGESGDYSYLYSVENGIAFLNIEGTLTCKPTMFSMLCGGISYMELQDCISEIAEDSGISTVVLNVSSGGGEAYGCFESSRFIRETLQGAGKRVIAYVDGLMASAAYALGCSADEIIMNPDSQTGSIGVVVSLMDNSKELEMEGLKPMWVYAGDSKIPYAEDGSFKQEFLDDLQKSVDETYDKFVTLVASMRQLNKQAVIDTQAKVYRANDAIVLGLADKQMTTAEFKDYLASIVNAEEVELPEPKHSNHGDNHDEEDAGCGKKKKAELDQQTILNLSIEETPLEELELLKAQAAEALALKEQMSLMQEQMNELANVKAKLEAEKQQAIKQAHLEKLNAFEFIGDAHKEALADMFMADAKVCEVLSGIFAKANAAIELAATEVVRVKDEFAKEQGVDTPIDTTPVAEPTAQEILNTKIAAQKAANR